MLNGDRAHVTTDREALETESIPSLWLKKLNLARDDEKDWMETARDAVEIYEGRDKSTAYNILHSSTQTLLPAIFNSEPVPDVRRRFGDADPVAKLVVDISERMLTFSCDEFDFYGEMKSVVKDALLTGRGIPRIRYFPSVEQTDMGEVITDQAVAVESVPWDKYIEGPARRWQDVPWIAFQHDLTLEDVARLAPEIDPREVGFTNGEKDGFRDGKPELVDDKGVYNTIRVYEIWDKRSRKILFIAETYLEQPLRIEDDPLGLEGFFCVPAPLQVVHGASSRVPVCPYTIIEPLIRELDTITKRITRLVKQLRVRALAAGITSSDLDLLKDAEDGQIATAQDTAGVLAAGGRLDQMISYFPMEPTVIALRELYTNREQIKQTIYEVSGIADAMRGNADADKKLGQTQIETQWGSLRVQDMQRDVARMSRDLFRMMTEVVANHFEPQIIQRITGIGQSEQDAQAFPMAIQILKSDMREYRIDIETDSTIRSDMTRSQEQMNLFIGATAQFGQAAVTVGQMAPQAIPALIEIYTAFARKFQLGKQAEDALDSLQRMGPEMAQQAQQAAQQAAQPQDDGSAEQNAAKIQAVQMKAQADMQRGEQQMMHDRERHMMNMEKERADIAAAAANQNSQLPN
jgi:hypothetical protein